MRRSSEHPIAEPTGEGSQPFTNGVYPANELQNHQSVTCFEMLTQGYLSHF